MNEPDEWFVTEYIYPQIYLPKETLVWHGRRAVCDYVCSVIKLSDHSKMAMRRFLERDGIYDRYFSYTQFFAAGQSNAVGVVKLSLPPNQMPKAK